jgi:adenylylsulfate reductase subunit B
MILINYDVCINCGKCEKICPCNVIGFKERPVIEDPEKCWHCFACVKECPAKAMKVRLPPHIADQRYEMLSYHEGKRVIFQVFRGNRVDAEYSFEVRR